MLADKTLRTFLDELASSAPAPGGGSVAALLPATVLSSGAPAVGQIGDAMAAIYTFYASEGDFVELTLAASGPLEQEGMLILTDADLGEVAVSTEGNLRQAITRDGLYTVIVTRQGDERLDRALHGLTRAMIANMVVGVTKGYEKALDIIGVGYGAKLQGKQLALTVGYADTRLLPIPEGVKVELPTATRVVVKGPDKQAVGDFAARVRKVRKPEPYQGKGIRYVDEVVRRKAGKAFAGTAGG